jgi:hypothetical protein
MNVNIELSSREMDKDPYKKYLNIYTVSLSIHLEDPFNSFDQKFFVHIKVSQNIFLIK